MKFHEILTWFIYGLGFFIFTYGFFVWIIKKIKRLFFGRWSHKSWKGHNLYVNGKFEGKITKTTRTSLTMEKVVKK